MTKTIPPCPWPGPHVVRVEPRDGYTVWVEFADGKAGLLDMTEDVQEEHWLVDPLRDLDKFRQVAADPDTGDLVWPHTYEGHPPWIHFDMSPEFAYLRCLYGDGQASEEILAALPWNG